MGQTYRGTEATFLDDAMFKLPYELMGGIIDKKDAQIKEDIEARGALSDLLKAQGLKVDEPRLQQILKGYQDEIDTSVQEIYKDPVNYNRESVQRLKRKINEDFTIGEVAAIQGNKTAFDTWKKEQAEKIKKNPELYDADMLDNLSTQILSKFKGTEYKGPSEYSTISTDDAIGIKDTLTVLDDIMKGAIPHFQSASWDNDKGGWNVKGKNETKFFKPQDLQDMYLGFLKTNPEYLRGVAQRESIGLPGWKGNFTPEGLPSFEEGSIFKDSMDLLKTKYGGIHRVTESGRTMNALGVAEAQDRLDTVYVETTLENQQATKFTNYAGKNNKEYNENVAMNQGIKTNAITKSLDYLWKKGGYSSLQEFEKDKPTIAKAIRSGNFSAVSNTAEGRQYAAEYKQAEFRQEVLRSSLAEFKRKYNVDPTNSKEFNKQYTFTDPKTKKKTVMTVAQAWNNHLADNYISSQTVNMSWEPTGLLNKQMKSVAEQVVNNGLHLDTPLTLPAGFTVKNKAGQIVDIGNQRYTVNELLKQGYLKIEQKGNSVLYKTETNKAINFDTKEGTGVVPILGYNDAGKIEYGINVIIDGKSVTGRISNISTEPVEKYFEGRPGKIFRGQRALGKIGKVQYTFPGTNVTYYGNDVTDANGKVIIPAGTLITGNNTRLNAYSEDALELIGEMVE